MLNSNLNEESVRAGLEETYRQIMQDLHEASELLSEIQKYRTRPSKAAAFALMARVYLAIEDYDQALHYANACLQLHSMFLDFNELDAEAPYPVPLFRSEEHTSELQSLMRFSNAVFCLKKKIKKQPTTN